MLFFQVSYKGEVSQYLADKPHVSDGVGTEQFLYFILILCVAFFLISIGMSAYMLLRRQRLIKEKIFNNDLIAKYQDFLSGFLILPIDNAFLGIQKGNALEHRLDVEDISDSKRRKILSKEIYELKKNLSGQQEIQLSNYFFGLGLQNEVLGMLKSRTWTEKVKAMQMIMSFSIQEYLPQVKEFVNFKNRELAIHAICVVMIIEKSVDVLYTINQKLNDWECHKIVHTMKGMNLDLNSLSKLNRNINMEGSLLQQLSIGLREEKNASPVLQ